MTAMPKCLAAEFALMCVGGCSTSGVPTHQIYNPVDGVQEYTQRADTVTLSAGNAQDVNERLQEVDPWPRHVADKRIAVNGERMANAVNRYRHQGPRPLPLERTSSTAAGGGGGAGGGAGGAGEPTSP
jgi:hypothetical protein